MPQREGEASDGADATGDPPPQPPPAPSPPSGAAAPPPGAVDVVIAVSEGDADRSPAGNEDARGAAAGDGDGKGKGKGETLADRGSEAGACVVIDVGRGGGGFGGGFGGGTVEGGGGGGGDWEGEKVCRICHLSPDQGEEASELIELGCGCKRDLGIAHRHCAEAWFKQRGNRCCEICGSNAKNITGSEDTRFVEEWHERRITFQRNTAERGGCWRRQPFCNFLMACLVIAFILPWFFRVNVF